MHLVKRCMIALMDLIRPMFGFQNICCIYPVSCTDYAKYLITHHRWYYYLPRITLRLLSCNPITALGRIFYERYLNMK